MNLKSRLLLALIPAILVTFGALMVISFKNSESTVLTQINKESFELARSNAREFDILFESSREIAEGLAISLGVMENLTAESVDELLQNTLSRNPGVYGKLLTTMMIGLAMIESLAIYVLVICLIILYANPYKEVALELAKSVVK